MSNDAPIHECKSEIDHYTGHYVPCSLPRVCGFFNIPQIFYMCKGLLDRAYSLLSLSEKTRKSSHLQMLLQRQHFLCEYFFLERTDKVNINYFSSDASFPQKITRTYQTYRRQNQSAWRACCAFLFRRVRLPLHVQKICAVTIVYGAPYWTLLHTFDICAKLQFDMLIVI